LALAHVASRFSIHPDRVFLIGTGEGATAAYRFGFAMKNRIAGIVALNGSLPVEHVPTNDLRVMIGHGTANPVVPVSAARRAAARLTASGARVSLSRYATAHRIHANMLRDANRWIMDQVAEKKAE
jgi:phospholipase/carboxylesterase